MGADHSRPPSQVISPSDPSDDIDPPYHFHRGRVRVQGQGRGPGGGVVSTEREKSKSRARLRFVHQGPFDLDELRARGRGSGGVGGGDPESGPEQVLEQQDEPQDGSAGDVDVGLSTPSSSFGGLGVSFLVAGGSGLKARLMHFDAKRRKEGGEEEQEEGFAHSVSCLGVTSLSAVRHVFQLKSNRVVSGHSTGEIALWAVRSDSSSSRLEEPELTSEEQNEVDERPRTRRRRPRHSLGFIGYVSEDNAISAMCWMDNSVTQSIVGSARILGNRARHLVTGAGPRIRVWEVPEEEEILDSVADQRRHRKLHRHVYSRRAGGQSSSFASSTGSESTRSSRVSSREHPNRSRIHSGRMSSPLRRHQSEAQPRSTAIPRPSSPLLAHHHQPPGVLQYKPKGQFIRRDVQSVADLRRLSVLDLVASAWSFPNKIVATYSDCVMRVYDVQGGTLANVDWQVRDSVKITALAHLGRHSDAVTGVLDSGIPRYRLFTGSEDGVVAAWDPRCKRRKVSSVHVFENSDSVRKIISLPRDRLLVSTRNGMSLVELGAPDPIVQQLFFGERSILNDVDVAAMDDGLCFLTLECQTYPRMNVLRIHESESLREIEDGCLELRNFESTEIMSRCLVLRTDYDDFARGQDGPTVVYPKGLFLTSRLLEKGLFLERGDGSELRRFGDDALAARLAKKPFCDWLLRKQNYEIVTNKKIEGGYGTIFFANAYHEGRIKVKFVVKRMRLSDASLRELELLMTIRSKHVIDTLGWWVDIEPKKGIFLAIVMERALCNLEVHLRKPGRLITRMRILCEVARAISYLHNLDDPIVHGDLKPANVLLAKLRLDRGSDEYTYSLCDFGSSWRLSDPPSIAPRVTPIYAGPEVSTARWEEKLGKTDEKYRYDPHKLNGLAVDVYSFGILCFEVLTGKEAFGHRQLDLDALHDLHQSRMRPDIDAEMQSYADSTHLAVQKVVRLVKRCWMHDVGERPSFVMKPSAEEVGEEEEEEDDLTDEEDLPILAQLNRYIVEYELSQEELDFRVFPDDDDSSDGGTRSSSSNQ